MRRVAQILIVMSMITSLIGCNTFSGPTIECKRPNKEEKAGWKALKHEYTNDMLYGPPLRWISEILEEDCFPKEAKAARNG